MEVVDQIVVDSNFINNSSILKNLSVSNGLSEDEECYSSFVKFMFNGVVITIVTIIGVCGNILSALVLSKPKMRSSCTLLLLGLTFCDTVTLIMSYLIQGLRSLVFDYFFGIHYADDLIAFLPNDFFIVSSFALTGSYYFTLALTLDRYVAVWWPLKSRYACTWSRARYVAGGVVLLSVAYPVFSNLYLTESPESLHNRTQDILSMCGEEFSYIPQDEAFKFIDASFQSLYLSWSYLIIMMFVPFTTLVVFNSLIYLKVREANRSRKSMTSQENKDISFAMICVVVTTWFLSCNSSLIVMAILMRFYMCTFQKWKAVLIDLDTFLVNVGASSNFIIYCVMGSRFRQQLKQMLGIGEGLENSVPRR